MSCGSRDEQTGSDYRIRSSNPAATDLYYGFRKKLNKSQ